MRVTLFSLVALLAGIQSTTALCCYYGSAGTCGRSLGERELKLPRESVINAICCCSAGSAAACTANC